jgi:hypothetical protein
MEGSGHELFEFIIREHAWRIYREIVENFRAFFPGPRFI